MDAEDFDSSEESIGSDGEQQGPEGYGNIAANDALLDSSDSDSDDEGMDGAEMEVDEDAANEQLKLINDQLAENPYGYELYVEKIKLLKQLGDLDKLRETREKFSEMYPLSEQIWLEWIKDEIKLACTDEEIEHVEKLFERAIEDYVSVEVWLEYISFAMGRMNTENGQQKCRDVFERALASCGIHVAMGSLVWDMYRDFEAALLGTVATEEQLQSQENRFISLCRRQLSVPLLGMTKTYEDVKSKIDVDENTQMSYKKALSRLEDLETLEARLIQAQPDQKLSLYKEYIASEVKTKGNPARVQSLYERAIVDFPLDSSIWLEYLDYLSKNLKINQIILGVAKRASRNCSWDINIWLKYMILVETFSEEDQRFDTIKSVFERAILYCSTGDTAGTVWLKYLEFLRRKAHPKSKPEEKEINIFTKTVDAAEQHLLQLLPEPNEFLSEILLFRIRFLTRVGNKTEANEYWKDLLTRGYGQYTKTWLQYILLEVGAGSEVRDIRSLYSKSLSYVKDDLQILSSLWINFERDNGDLSSLQQCESKISTAMAKLATELAVIPEEQASTGKLDSRKPFASASVVTVTKGAKRKINDQENFNAKKGRQGEDAVDGDAPSSVFKVPSIPVAAKDHKADKTGQNQAVSNSRHGETVKHDPSKDNRSVFLSNLAYTTNEQQIVLFFADIGHVEVSLAKDYRGRSKGFGYGVFDKVADAKAALAKDRQLLEGRPAFVSKCDADKNTRQKQFKFPTQLEKNKLFVKGLPKTLTADEVRDLFKIHGDLKDVRLVTLRNGHSKGLAYVEYIDEACAKQAIMKTDGTMIGEHKISVALSNPPAKDAPKMSFSSSRNAQTNSDPQRRAPKAFVPRSLQISSNKKAQGETPAPTATPSAPKSNQDFRSMFLKQ